MSDTNGIKAMLAHSARAGDDNIYVRSIIESYLFLGFGTVSAYANERITVTCGGRKYTNVEVMVFGVDGWGIKPVPAVNDRVMLFSTQAPVPDLKQFKAPGSMPAYDTSGLKAIPITDSNAAQLITVDVNGVVITGNNKITINNDGIQIEDNNGNKVVTASKSVTVSAKIDSNTAKIELTSSGFNIADSNGNTITSSDNDGVKINNKLQIKK